MKRLKKNRTDRMGALSFSSFPHAPLSLVSPTIASPSLRIPPIGPSSSLPHAACARLAPPGRPRLALPINSSSSNPCLRAFQQPFFSHPAPAHPGLLLHALVLSRSTSHEQLLPPCSDLPASLLFFLCVAHV
jgi:hypothetical protein